MLAFRQKHLVRIDCDCVGCSNTRVLFLSKPVRNSGCLQLDCSQNYFTLVYFSTVTSRIILTLRMNGAYTYASGVLFCISSLLLPELLWVTHHLERNDRWVVI